MTRTGIYTFKINGACFSPDNSGYAHLRACGGSSGQKFHVTYQSNTERFPTSFALFFDGLKNADRGDDGGRPGWAAAQFGEQLPGLEGGHRAFAGSAVAGVGGVDLPLRIR
jgi:hypothetical protein